MSIAVPRELPIQKSLRKLIKPNKPQRNVHYAEFLLDFELIVWVDGPIADRLLSALKNPAEINRWGALCLGETNNLVTDFVLSPDLPPELFFLVPSKCGSLSMSTWVRNVDGRIDGAECSRFDIKLEKTSDFAKFFVTI